MEKRKARRKGKGVILLFSILLFIIFCSFVVSAAENVAYIYRNKLKIDKNILGVFSDLGLTVDLIQENNLTLTDFSKYKMIFVGDERFKYEEKIPVRDYPSVVSNYYFSYEWGLTNDHGVSQLGSTSPLSVRNNGNIIQVYTKSQNKGSAITYYYLSDINKLPRMSSVVRTYTGSLDGRKLGDVISYSNSGPKICFYGIIESKYWTPAARNMFMDCVNYAGTTCYNDNDCADEEIGEGYCSDSKVYQDVIRYHCENPGTVHSQCVDDIVSEPIENCTYACINGNCIRCDENSDCNDNNIFTEDICMNPNTNSSKCTNNPIACFNNPQCGTDGFIGDFFCSINNKNVMKDFITFTCNNPGKTNSSCTNKTEAKSTQNCTNFCANGKCVECLQDSNCNSDYYEESYCSSKNIYHNLIDYSCQNYKCVSQEIPELLDNCTENEICSDRECKKITCSLNSDCGINGFSGWKYCQNTNSYEDFMSFTCMKPGTLESYCTNYTLQILQEYCDFECISGECYTCFNNLSCGTNGFIEDKYCGENNVYQDYKQFECINPATPDSDCLSSIFPKLIEECADVCILGECVDIKCYDDTECNDFNVSTIDKCVNPATVSSYCSHTSINCINNEDCGITGFIGNELCFENNVFKNYQNSTCINPGTSDSYCDVSFIPKFLVDCGNDEYTDWQFYCTLDNLYKKRNFYDRGCSKLSSDGYGCFENDSLETTFVKECEFGCALGECLPECTQNSDCETESWSENYCSGGNVIREHIIPVCINETCGIENLTEIIEYCDFGCQNSSCLPGIHDVALIDFSDAVNKIKITNYSDALATGPLLCNQKYKIIIKAENQGNFSENITFNGEINGLLFSHTVINNATPDYTSIEKERTVNFTLPAGFYNITVNAIIPIDDFPLNNIASRQIQVICPECFTNNDCGSQTSELICQGKNVTNKTITPTCQDGSCVNVTAYEFVETCADVCVDGHCEDIVCYNNSECGSDGYTGDYYCDSFSGDVYRNYQSFTCVNPGTILSSCSSSISDILIGDCVLGCLNGTCLGCV